MNNFKIISAHLVVLWRWGLVRFMLCSSLWSEHDPQLVSLLQLQERLRLSLWSLIPESLDLAVRSRVLLSWLWLGRLQEGLLLGEWLERLRLFGLGVTPAAVATNAWCPTWKNSTGPDGGPEDTSWCSSTQVSEVSSDVSMVFIKLLSLQGKRPNWIYKSIITTA